MSIEQELRRTLTEAMKQRDQRTADVIRMINSRVTERRTAKGFKGEVDDELYIDVISSYRKSLSKAREEYLAAGERGAEQAEALKWEIGICERFLPPPLSPEELRQIVREAIAATGISEPRMAGRVVGEVMKTHKGRVEAGQVKRIAEEELGA